MKVTFYTSRDSRTGEPLNVERDGYKFEHPDIMLSAEITYLWGEFEIEEARVVFNNGLEILKNDSIIELDDYEFEAAVDEFWLEVERQKENASYSY